MRGDRRREGTPATSLTLVRADLVEPRAIRWLWQNRFALGKLSLVVGNPGLGKSQITVDMAARVSTGRDWPGGGAAPVGDVVILSAEDDAEDTIVPRLTAAGADRARVYLVQSVRDGDRRRGFDVTTDLELLEDVLKTLKNVVMIVIDPITAYLGMRLDSHKTTDVRAALQPLSELAQQYGVALLGVTHMPKNSAGAAVMRTIGSIAFAAAARAIFYVIEQKTPEGAPTERRLFLPGKNNLAVDRGTGLAYQVEGKDGVSVISWYDGTVETTVEEALGEPTRGGLQPKKREAAEAFIREFLADGPRGSADVRRAAAERGVSEKSLRDARERLGVAVVKSGTGASEWRLPEGELPF